MSIDEKALSKAMQIARDYNKNGVHWSEFVPKAIEAYESAKSDQPMLKGEWDSERNCPKGQVPVSHQPVELAKLILGELDEVARNYDHYEYGLPLIHEEQMQKMLAVVVPHLRQPERESGWVDVADGLPKDGDIVLMAYDDTPEIVKGKYFDGDSMLNGFAAKSAKGNHYVGKPFVKWWMLCPKSPYNDIEDGVSHE